MITKIFMAVAVVFIAVSCAQAQNVQIPVRCTVPAIPGVNSPLIEASSSGDKGYISTGNAQEQTSTGKKLVKTYYAR